MDRHVYIIAEVGPNHNGDFNIAMNMIDKIASTGVDAIKFQMFNPDKLYSLDAFKANYQNKNDKNRTIKEMSNSHFLTKDEHYKLYLHCKEVGVDYICTAFDMESLLFLESKFDFPYYKIASGELFSLDIIEHISKQKKPIILSTGMATYDEIGNVIQILNQYHKKNIVVLHCISNYPAEYSEVNLNNMLEIKDRFGCEVGFSDHTIGNECAIAAVSLGAIMIEKHVTFDRNAIGPDHKSSIEIDELGSLVSSIRHIEKALGVRERVFTDAQREIASVAKKSCVTIRNIKKGEIIRREDICFKRPGTGVRPMDINILIGKRAICDIDADRLIKLDYLQ